MAPDYARIEEDALRTLELLCRKASVSAEGRELDETAALVEELLRELGFETRQLRAEGGPPAVWAERRGRSPYTLLLYNHYDVQPVDPLELWESPPFEPMVRDGKFYARGTSDNKGELAVRLAVIRALLDETGGLPVGIRWIVEGEEEVGSPNFEAIVAANVELLRADGCLWEGASAVLPDGRPELALGFKGALFVRLHVRALATDAHSSLAAIAPSAAWRLVDALASLRGADGRVAVDGFYAAAKPPTDAERRALAAASESEEDELRADLGIAEFLDGLTGNALSERAAYGPTSNIAGLTSGYAGPGVKTVLPAEASALLDFRLVPDQRPAEIAELLRAHLDRFGYTDVELTVLDSAEPATTPLDHPFAARVAAVAETVTGAAPSIIPIAPPTLPIIAPLQRLVGVPGLAAPDNPIYSGSRAHAPNEHIRLSDVQPAIRFTYALLQDLATAR